MFTVVFSQADQTLRLQVDQKGDFILIGNTLGYDGDSGVPTPVVGTVGDLGLFVDDPAPDVFWRSDSPVSGRAEANTNVSISQARSSAHLILPTNTGVSHAFLYWSAYRSVSVADTNVTIEHENGLNTNLVAIRSFVDPTTGAYQAVADITTIVKTYGSGVYSVSGVDSIDLVNRSLESAHIGWTMVIFYRDITQPLRNLALFDGFDKVDTSHPQTVSLSGFLVPPTFTAKLGVIAYGGDDRINGDKVHVNGGSPVNDRSNGPEDFFNSTRSYLGDPVSTIGDLPQLTGGPKSMAGIDMDVVDVADRFRAGQTSTVIEAKTSNDQYYMAAFITSIESFKPDFSFSIKTITDTNGGLTYVGDTLEYTIEARNLGNDLATNVMLTDPLAPGLSYVPRSLEIVNGPNRGLKTDSSSDDQAEYNSTSRTITFRLGNGANATQGGTLATNETTTIRFLVTIDNGASTTITNQAFISAAGARGAPTTVFPTDDDGRDPLGGLTTISVVANQPPVNSVPGTQIVDEDTILSLPISITDPDATTNVVRSTLTITNTSGILHLSPQSGLTIRNNDSSSVQLDGSISAINAGLATLVYIPVSNLNRTVFGGTVTFTVFTEDLGYTGAGTPQSDTDTIDISITPVDDPAVISPLIASPQNILQDQSAGPFSFSVVDPDNPDGRSLFVFAEFTNPALLTNNSVVISGSSGNFSLSVTPLSGQSGSSTIYYIVGDGTGGFTTNNFVLNVNGRPTVSPLISSPQRSLEDEFVGPLIFGASDPETSSDNLMVNVFSSDESIIPSSNIFFNYSSAIAWEISYIPLTNVSGSSVIYYVVSDGSNPPITNSFIVEVSSVDDLPSISPLIPSPQVVGNGQTAGPFNFTVIDPDTPPQNLSLITFSTITSLVPNENITVTASSPNFSLAATPVSDVYGVTTIYYIIHDDLQNVFVTNAFVLIVSPGGGPGNTIQIATLDAIAAEEGLNPGLFTITRVGDEFTNAVTINLSINGTAQNGIDYTRIITPISFTPNQVITNIFLLPLINLPTNEPAESVVLEIASGNYHIGTSSNATIWIVADDQPGDTLQVNTNNVVEIIASDPVAAEDGPDHGLFRIQRSGAGITNALSVIYTMSGTADNGQDYETLLGSVYMPENVTTVELPVNILVNPPVNERAETVIATVEQANYLPGRNNSATVNIRADQAIGRDTIVSIAVLDAIAAEQDTNTATFTIARTGPGLANPITITLAISGTAQNGMDYESISSSVTLPSNVSSTNLVVTPLVNPPTNEPAESIVLTLSPDVYSINPPGNATAWIVADGQPGDTLQVNTNNVVEIVASDPVAGEDGPDHGLFRIQRSGAGITNALSVIYTMSGTADNGQDYETLLGSVYMPENVTTVELPVNILVNPPVDEQAETVIATVEQANYSPGRNNSATVDIQADQAIGRDTIVSIAVLDAIAAEQDTNTATFTIARTGPGLANPITITLAISGTAQNGMDYESIANSVTLPSNVSSSNLVVVPLVNLPTNELAESIILTLSPDVYSINPPGNATAWIVADGQPGDTLQVNTNNVVEIITVDGMASESGPDNGLFRIQRSGAGITNALSVIYTMDGTAENGEDYETLVGSVYMPENVVTVDIPVNTLVNEPANEPDETVISVLEHANYLLGVNNIAIMVISADPLPFIATVWGDFDKNGVTDLLIHSRRGPVQFVPFNGIGTPLNGMNTLPVELINLKTNNYKGYKVRGAGLLTDNQVNDLLIGRGRKFTVLDGSSNFLGGPISRLTNGYKILGTGQWKNDTNNVPAIFVKKGRKIMGFITNYMLASSNTPIQPFLNTKLDKSLGSQLIGYKPVGIGDIMNNDGRNDILYQKQTLFKVLPSPYTNVMTLDFMLLRKAQKTVSVGVYTTNSTAAIITRKGRKRIFFNENASEIYIVPKKFQAVGPR